MKSLCAPVLAIQRGDGIANRPVLLASKFYFSLILKFIPLENLSKQ